MLNVFLIFRDSEQISQILSTGQFQDVGLRGNVPTMTYKEDIIDGFIEAIKTKFNIDPSKKTVINSTKILFFENWPAADSLDIQGFTD